MNVFALPFNLFFFSKWSDFFFGPIRWIRQIGQDHLRINRIQIQSHASTENILVQRLKQLTAKQVI